MDGGGSEWRCPVQKVVGGDRNAAVSQRLKLTSFMAFVDLNSRRGAITPVAQTYRHPSRRCAGSRSLAASHEKEKTGRRRFGGKRKYDR